MLTSAETWLLNPLESQILHFPIGTAAEQPVKKSWGKKEVTAMLLVKNANSQSQRSQAPLWNPDILILQSCARKNTQVELKNKYKLKDKELVCELL